MLDFINELAVAATGTDCTATAAWLNVRMQDGCTAGEPGALALRRAAQFWELADEAQQAAIGSCIGLTEPAGERFPANDGIAADFKAGCEFAYTVVGEPG